MIVYVLKADAASVLYQSWFWKCAFIFSEVHYFYQKTKQKAINLSVVCCFIHWILLTTCTRRCQQSASQLYHFLYYFSCWLFDQILPLSNSNKVYLQITRRNESIVMIFIYCSIFTIAHSGILPDLMTNIFRILQNLVLSFNCSGCGLYSNIGEWYQITVVKFWRK